MNYRLSLFVVAALLVGACSTTPETPAIPTGAADRVAYFIQQDLYDEALTAAAQADTTEAARAELLFAAHYTYGMYLMNPEQGNMREVMPRALRHLRRALELNPNSAEAKANIELIEGIYTQMGREIPEGSAQP